MPPASPPPSTAPVRIVISEFMDTPAVDALRAHHDVHHDPDLAGQPGKLADLLGQAQGLIVRNRTQVTRALLDAAPRLKVIGRLGVGLDNIDLEAAAERRIAVCPARGANARAVAEYALTAVLVTLRGLHNPAVGADMAAGTWPRTALIDGQEADGKTLGLVGFGNIGQLTARLAQAIGLHVIATDPAHTPEFWQRSGVEGVSLEALLERSHAVSLHVPLNESTRGLFDAATLARIRPGAVFINTARGGIVDETALAGALRSGHLSGAAIDVFGQEPLPAGSPLANLRNVWLTPHVAGLSREANVRVSTLVAEQVLDILGRSGPH
ncbi:hydroxyacid dehydrogenase [Pseudothauera nasutitermitis]|uniref:Hydroxyacid dehydrogenase n=1 Tax=Pseudothauera nasutitermitis TaxID=2565930 RepID=A0A4S4B3V8_9RHOO|nr:hydroxyacid dehydrogenase [Pseudothauera nasutitermitis]THF67352.1 hydroxyacid dehydrogenase [Pseudothauera nasutitermitis]